MAEIRDEVAGKLITEAQRRWLAGLDATLRHPTGAYRSRITPYGPRAGQGRVHDQQCVYGPWLEGTGSRNRTTRFKGYRNARNVTSVLNAAAPALAEHVVAQNLHKLGG